MAGEVQRVVIAVKREQRGAVAPDWAQQVADTGGVTLITPPDAPRLIADVTPEALPGLHARWGEWLHIEPLVTRGPS